MTQSRTSNQLAMNFNKHFKFCQQFIIGNSSNQQDNNYQILSLQELQYSNIFPLYILHFFQISSIIILTQKSQISHLLIFTYIEFQNELILNNILLLMQRIMIENFSQLKLQKILLQFLPFQFTGVNSSKLNLDFDRGLLRLSLQLVLPKPSLNFQKADMNKNFQLNFHFCFNNNSLCEQELIAY
ncbi:unnamed protein product (macronuclear) [Paramecium tetraurelia]|uniref:Transmembrane protein n=1 Tax=Paramecium tetraurelia TaxID=5888 RepID=A0CY25_PARTE|nr:uncharacterized protein GSPATT00011324001 [Paramecium tetraurelia]CAK75692.1 unnamed protein product [Paramecium tetraurelia]|eukprot:XP_001443089.1 hypothetical protein (macronuclear) [Paramecium tetraurelia strain d4-2]